MAELDNDALIRLVSATHKVACPLIGQAGKVSFSRSLKTAGSHPTTRALIAQADSARDSLAVALAGSCSNGPDQKITGAAQTYVPLVHQIMVSCMVQPELARLDERLLFEWTSGIETNERKTKKPYQNEGMMYDMVMTLSCEAMGYAGSACDESAIGDFTSAARNLKAAAGVMRCLAEDQLPKWVGMGVKDLPSEATIWFSESFKTLFLAEGQQMAVASVLSKPEDPNYSLLAKLCLGIAEQMELFITTMKAKAGKKMEVIDSNLMALVHFQISLQRALSLFFLARSFWGGNAYGNAIAVLREAVAFMKFRKTPDSKGLPKIDSKSSLKPMITDVTGLQNYMQKLLQSWEQDNATVFYDRIPTSIPNDQRLSNGLKMMKPEPYELEEPKPVTLMLPARKVPLSLFKSIRLGGK